MKLEFVRDGHDLLIYYCPEYNYEVIKQKLSEGEEVYIKNCFQVTKAMERLSDRTSDGETFCFCIGNVGNEYTEIESKSVGTRHSFYFANEIELQENMFIAYSRISILPKIDNVIDGDFYVGGSNENCLPIKEYRGLLHNFPTTTEIKRYQQAKVANAVREYFSTAETYQVKYDKYLARRSKTFPQNDILAMERFNAQTELHQFTILYEKLLSMLGIAGGLDEGTWQIEIHKILGILYPKYVTWDREIKIPAHFGLDKHDRRPDFIVVDANGYIDVIEIKKPETQLLTLRDSYRNNYVPVRDLSGTIQQIEKYICCLNRWGEIGEKYLTEKLSDRLPSNLAPKIVNPQGILITGRSNDFDEQKKSDFELIKRQYKHVAEILTYDDLLFRIGNIKAALEKKLLQENTTEW